MYIHYEHERMISRASYLYEFILYLKWYRPGWWRSLVVSSPLGSKWGREIEPGAILKKSKWSHLYSFQTNYFEQDRALNDEGKEGFRAGQQQRGVVLLTVLNATAEDSGLFWCVADNGIGGRQVRNATFLLVRRKLDVLGLNLWRLRSNQQLIDHEIGT
jgi:hypothetical protein